MSVLDPLSHLLALVLAATHSGATALGAGPGSGLAWVLAVAGLVVVVRVALLPLAVQGVRLAHASARARPHLRALTEDLRRAPDAASRRRLLDQRRRITAEHGVPRLGCLPLLVQVPVWIALYRLVSDVATGLPVGAMGHELVAALGAATLLGVPLAERGYLGAGATHLLVVAGLATAAAVLGWATQRLLVLPNAVLDDLPEAMARTQQLLPVVSALGLLVAGGVVPVALLLYWVCNAAWTGAQAFVVVRFFPTPGTPAAARRSAG